MKPASPSSVPDSSNSGRNYGVDPEGLELNELPIVTGEDAEAMERTGSGPMSLEEYARFVKCFRWTAEQLRAIPTSEGLPRFTLDD